MADSIETWRNKIIAEIEAEASIIVDSPSKFSRWGLWRDIVALISQCIQKIWEGTILEFQEKVKSKPLLTTYYYRLIALAFQYGDPLYYLGDRYGYVSVNTAKQVCNVCHVTEYTIESGNPGTQKGLRIHPGNQAADGTISALSTLQQAEFENYMEELKACGRRISYYSGAAANLIITIDIKYDPNILNPDGSLFLDPATNPIEDAIQDYMDTWVNYEGNFNETELRKRLFAIDGVADLDYTRHRYDAAGGTTYTNITDHIYLLDRLVDYNKAGTSEITYTSI